MTDSLLTGRPAALIYGLVVNVRSLEASPKAPTQDSVVGTCLDR